MQVLTVLSQKGGSGKTTLTGHIAVQAERTGAGTGQIISHRNQWSQQDERQPAQRRREPKSRNLDEDRPDVDPLE